MYYSSGNYEAFARPKKPEGVDNKSAYIVGSGLAALTAACYLVRDGQMKGEHVHVLEKGDLPGGACDGYKFENLGYVMRGGREMDNHFEVMWDLFRSIPSIETEGVSVLDDPCIKLANLLNNPRIKFILSAKSGNYIPGRKAHR